MNLRTINYTDGVYLEIPKFWYKFDSNNVDVTFEPEEGYIKHKAFDVYDQFYVPLYLPSLVNSNSDSLVYVEGKKPAQMGKGLELNSIGILEAKDIIDYCLEQDGHCMTIFEVSAINILEYYLHQQKNLKYFPVNGLLGYDKVLRKTGTFKSMLGLYDMESMLWQYATGLIRPQSNDKFLMFRDLVNPNNLDSFEIYNNLDLYKEYDNDILANTMRYIEYRGPTDNFTTVDDMQMFLPNLNDRFYKYQTLLTTDGVFSYHRPNMFVKVFGCYDTNEGKGIFTKDLFSFDKDNWYNSSFRIVRNWL